MDELIIIPVNGVVYQKQHYQIRSVLHLERVLLVKQIQGKTVVAEIRLLASTPLLQPLIAKTYNLSGAF